MRYPAEAANHQQIKRMNMQINIQTDAKDTPNRQKSLRGAEFRIDAVKPGNALLVGDAVAFNVLGRFCATDAKCPHLGGPLTEDPLAGSTVTCPWHGSKVDVCMGAVLRDPAKEPSRPTQSWLRAKSEAWRQEN